jgi:hypothetical protein
LVSNPIEINNDSTKICNVYKGIDTKNYKKIMFNVLLQTVSLRIRQTENRRILNTTALNQKWALAARSPAKTHINPFHNLGGVVTQISEPGSHNHMKHATNSMTASGTCSHHGLIPKECPQRGLALLLCDARARCHDNLAASS